MTDSFTKYMYETHHREHRSGGFSILKENRGVYFKKIIGTGKRVLDVGCRDGALTQFFTEGNQVLGVDIDEVALAKARRDLGIEIASLDLHGTWQELQGRTFDAVVAGEVLEHLFYPEKVVAHIAACLNSEGVFTGSVPNAFSLKNRLRYLFAQKKNTPLSDPTHINHFSAAMLRDMLSKHFSSVAVSGLGKYSRLAALCPSWFAFDLVFVAKGKVG